MNSGWYDIYDEQRSHETDGGMNHEDYVRVIDAHKIHAVPIEKRDEFNEWCAEEYGWQDYGNIVEFSKRGTFHKDEIKEILAQIEKEENKEEKTRGEDA